MPRHPRTTLFTPVQSRIIDILSDGELHSKEDFIPCLHDELSGIKSVPFHMSTIRKILRPLGFDVVSVYFRGTYQYRYVALLKKDPSSPLKSSPIHSVL